MVIAWISSTTASKRGPTGPRCALLAQCRALLPLRRALLPQILVHSRIFSRFNGIGRRGTERKCSTRDAGLLGSRQHRVLQNSSRPPVQPMARTVLLLSLAETGIPANLTSRVADAMVISKSRTPPHCRQVCRHRRAP